MSQRATIGDLLRQNTPMGQARPGPGEKTMVQGTVPGSPAAERVTTPLGAIFPQVRHPGLSTYERGNRVTAVDAFTDPDRSPENPYSFVVLSEQIGVTEVLLIQEIEFRLGGFGHVPGDEVILEPGQMTTRLGFDFVVNESRPLDAKYAIDPQPIPGSLSSTTTISQGNGRTPPTAAVFALNPSVTFSATGGAGSAAMPNQFGRQGPSKGPFTIYVPAGGVYTARVIISQPLPFPLAFVQFNAKGYKMDATKWEQYLPLLK